MRPPDDSLRRLADLVAVLSLGAVLAALLGALGAVYVVVVVNTFVG